MGISLHSLVKSFDGEPVVRDLSLDVDDGEFLVLLGPSGCGKTTTLRVIAGLETPDSGEVHISGRRVDGLAPKDRGIAMVFQDYALYRHMSVFDNVAFPLEVGKRLEKAEVERRVEATLGLLAIARLAHRSPAALSGGEQQRVALARAIVREPAAFLMDEPLANLDAQLRVQMRTELMVLHRRLGIATICVSHDQLDAMTLGTRIAVMDSGVIRQVGTPFEVYKRPADLFVAGFLGTPRMNFLKSLANGDRSVRLRSRPDEDIPVPSVTAGSQSSKRELVVGVRPERVRLVGEAESGIDGAVYVTENMGADMFVHVAVSEDETVVLRAAPDVTLSVGDRVRVGWSKEDGLVFDADTGLLMNHALETSHGA
jgi:multiple sugar transport system ATP-binding protein